MRLKHGATLKDSISKVYKTSRVLASTLLMTTFTSDRAALSLVNAGLRALLCGVTLVSSLGKFADMVGTRQAMGDFGVPARLVSLAARLLPVVELGLALALLVDPLSKSAARAVAFLMVGFAVGLYNLVRQNKRPPCHCFGAVHSAPVGKGTVLRSILLAAMAGLTAQLPTFPMNDHPGKIILGLALVLALTGAAIHRRKRLGMDATRLMAGQRLPALRLSSGRWLEDLLGASERSLLLILSPGCGPCKHLQASLEEWKLTLTGRLHLLPVYLEGEDHEHTLESEQFQLLKSATPGAMLVDRKGSLLHPPVTGAEEIEALIRVALASTP